MATRTTTAWIVPLKGHAFDIEDLPLYLQGSPVSIEKRGEGYFLVLPTCLAGPTYERVGALAHEHIALINGAASILLDTFRPIKIAAGPYFGIDENDDIASTVVPVGTVEHRCKAGHMTALLNGVSQLDQRAGQVTRLLRAAAASTAMADALVIVGRPAPSWSELYLVYELVEANSGARMNTESWIGRAEGRLFSRTANSYTALGRAGRHGKDRGDPPPVPMSQHTATRLMRSLVAAWLKDAAVRQEDAG